MGWWLAGVSSFAGQAAASAEGEQLGELTLTRCEGTAAVSIAGGRVLGIVSPNAAAVPAVWWSWALTAVDITTAGTLGTFKKRPQTITLTLGGSSVELTSVSRLYRNSGRYQDGQEASLLKALGG